MDHPDGMQDLAPEVDSLVRGVGPVLNSRGASHFAPEAQSAQGPLVLNDAVRRRWLSGLQQVRVGPMSPERRTLWPGLAGNQWPCMR